MDVDFISNRIFYCNSGLGLASVPDFWKVFHAGGATVHRTEIESYSDINKVHLTSGQTLETDFVILCTGWTDNLDMFSSELRAQYGLPSQEDLSLKWKRLDRQAEAKVNEKLPILARSPDVETSTVSQRRPWRLYRRLVPPAMAAQNDRSVIFPGQIHSVFTPLVAELQALWGVAFLLGRLQLPGQADKEEEIAVWNAWTRKRYLEQGMKHAYSVYDYIAVSIRGGWVLTNG